MGKFIFGGGGIPNKVLYNGTEVKKILFNDVEVWCKTFKVTMNTADQTETINFTVPNGVTQLNMTFKNFFVSDINKSFTVTPGETANFTFHSYHVRGTRSSVEYSFNGSAFEKLGRTVAEITISWP